MKNDIGITDDDRSHASSCSKALSERQDKIDARGRE